MPPLFEFDGDGLALEFLLSEGRHAVTDEARGGPGDVVREGEEVRPADSLENCVTVLRVSPD